MANALVSLGAALVLLACIAVAWPWIRLPRIKPETQTTITECGAALLFGISALAAAIASGAL